MKLVVLLAILLVVAGCGDDDADDTTPPSTTAAPAPPAPEPTVPIGASEDEPESEGPADTDECELDPSSGDRPSIGEVSRSIDPSLMPEGVSSRDVGLALVTLVDQGELCLEDVVAYVNETEETDDFRSALEAVLTDLAAPSG